MDESGLVHTTGYRKSAIANVTVSRGDGKFDINGLSLLEAFPLIQSREQILYPFVVVDGLGLFDVKATVEGGGKSGKCVCPFLPVCVFVCAYVTVIVYIYQPRG